MIVQDIFDVKYFNDILNQIRLNKNEGTETFFRDYQVEIIKIVFKFPDYKKLVNEIVNDTLISIWNYAQKKKYVENPHGFLYVVVINCIKDKLKVKSKCEPLNDFIPIKTDFVEQVVANDKFDYLLKPLNDMEKEIVTSKIRDKMTFYDISTMRNQPCATVSSIFYRALKKIEKKSLKNK